MKLRMGFKRARLEGGVRGEAAERWAHVVVHARRVLCHFVGLAVSASVSVSVSMRVRVRVNEFEFKFAGTTVVVEVERGSYICGV